MSDAAEKSSKDSGWDTDFIGNGSKSCFGGKVRTEMQLAWVRG